MKKKIRFLPVLAVIVIIIVGVFWLGNNKITEPQTGGIAENNTSTEKEGAPTFLYSTTTIIQSDLFYNINAEYPQFSKTSDGFNDKIKSLVYEKIDVFKKDAQNYWQARKETAAANEIIPDNPEEPFDFVLKWTPNLISDEYISFVMDIYYFSGGAHGINEIKAFNYDITNKKEISINDFLGNKESSLRMLSDMAEKNVITQLEEKDVEIDNFIEQMIKSGTELTNENYANFNFSSDSLIIYFQQYQVVPGAYGSVTVTLPKSIFFPKPN